MMIGPFVRPLCSFDVVCCRSSCTLYMNSKTNECDLQLTMESYMEKRAGKTFTPIGNKKHIFFVDDLNMPSFDKWGTQCPLELLIQLLSARFFFDRNKIGVLKEIRNCQYISAMNPTVSTSRPFFLKLA